ncbi:MAG: C-GCAxxG-C-C family protein [Clostridia bacterium]|nr:C-GCAxxG-C-C family protein [Clostridia bacterium]
METDYVKRAGELFMTGCNCSESLFAAFAGRYGIDEAQALKMSIGLGGGVGRMREVCGAVTAAAAVLGLEYGSGEEGGADKLFVYEKVQRLCAEFKKKYPTLICRDLLGETDTGGAPAERTEEYYKTRPCLSIIQYTAEILSRMLDE